jgi:hypothetical protein
MIRYLKHDEIDMVKWDQCILSSFNGMIYAYTWYLDTVCENWEALVESDYERVFPLTAGKKYGICYLYQPFFTQQLGIFSKSILNAEIVNNFLNSIPSKYKYIEINLNILNKIESNHIKVIPQLNYELDLIHNYDHIYKNYSKNTRRNVKKAGNAELTIVKNIKPDELIKMFRENRGKEIITLKENDYLMLNRLIYTCIYKGNAELYGAFTERNELCGGAVFVTSNKKAVFLFSGLDAEGREKGAMFLIIDAFIKEHAQNHLVFDFDGSNDPNLARFYRGFGSNECYYFRIERKNLLWPISLAVKIVKWIRR